MAEEISKKPKSTIGFYTSSRERIAFGLFMAGQTLFNNFFNGFSAKFLTEMGISAATVGTVVIAIRVFDAANDPVFGGIIDRAKFKGGKFLPWLKLSAILLPLFSVALFLMPNQLDLTMKVVWASAFSLLFSVAYTICDVPIFSMISASTDLVQERVFIMSRNSIFSAVATLIATVVVPLVYPQVGWGLTAVGVAALATPMMIAMGRVGKERFINKDPDKVTIRVMAKYLSQNKFMVTYFLGLLIFYSTATTAQAAVFFADFNLGDPAQLAIITLTLFLPAFAFIIILPFFTKKIDKFNIFMFCVFGQIAVSIVSYFAGYENTPIFLLLMAVRGVFWGGNTMMMLMFTPDFIEYGEFKTGKRLQGTMNSIQTFICKLFTAIAGGFVMFIMSAFGFQEGADVVQNQGTLDSIWFLVALMPAVGAVLSLVFFMRYKLRDKDVQLMAKVNSGEISKEQADAEFSHPY